MEEQAFQCGYCGAQFGSKEQLEQHSHQQKGHEAAHDHPRGARRGGTAGRSSYPSILGLRFGVSPDGVQGLIKRLRKGRGSVFHASDLTIVVLNVGAYHALIPTGYLHRPHLNGLC